VNVGKLGPFRDPGLPSACVDVVGTTAADSRGGNFNSTMPPTGCGVFLLRRWCSVAPRASWKGYLKLSLVSCAVALYPAQTSTERISFNQLNRATGNRYSR
jgi:hypothetical protein